jgi:hypothetical protein
MFHGEIVIKIQKNIFLMLINIVVVILHADIAKKEVIMIIINA